MKRWGEFNFDAPPLVVSYDGGVHSTAMLVGFHQRRIRPDLIMMADPGNEKTQTYKYLPVINDWIQSMGFPTTCFSAGLCLRKRLETPLQGHAAD